MVCRLTLRACLAVVCFSGAIWGAGTSQDQGSILYRAYLADKIAGIARQLPNFCDKNQQASDTAIGALAEKNASQIIYSLELPEIDSKQLQKSQKKLSDTLESVIKEKFNNLVSTRYVSTVCYCLNPLQVIQDKGVDSIPDSLRLQTTYDSIAISHEELLNLEKAAFPLTYQQIEQQKDAALFSPLLRDMQMGQRGTTASTPLSGIAWQTKLLTGLGDFLIERATAELQASFGDELKKFFLDDNLQGLLTTIFPATWSQLDSLNILAYKSALPRLKAAMETDMHELPSHTVAYFDANTNTTCIQRARLHLMKPAAACFEQLIQGDDPLLVLSQLKRITFFPESADTQKYNERKEKDLAAVDSSKKAQKENEIDNSASETNKIGLAVKTVGMIANEIYLYDNSDLAVRTESFIKNKRLFDTNVRHLLLAFLYHDIIKSDSEFRVLIVTDSLFVEKVRSVEAPLLTFMDATERLRDALQQIRSSQGGAANKYEVYATIFFDMLHSAKDLVGAGKEDTVLSKAFGIIEHTTKINEAIIQQDYPHIALYAVQCLRTDFDVHFSKKAERLVSFVTNIADADSSADVKAAIETFVDPVGSFRAKREKKGQLYVTINSYVGVATGFETLIGHEKATDRGKFINYLGVAAPIGIEIGHPACWGSWGGMLTILDLGNFVNYRLKDTKVQANSTIDNNPEIGFSQVFAPGVYFVLGLSKSKPISLGVGAQYMADLRKLNDTDKGKISAWRLGGFLGVDLALLKL